MFHLYELKHTWRISMNIRHTQNKNLTILNQPNFLGIPVYSGVPLAVNYLHAINNTMTKAVNEHCRTFAVRVDLHLPGIVNDVDYPIDFENKLMSRFIDSFKAKLNAAEQRKRKAGKRIYPCTVRNLWARERCEAEKDHFHVFLFLNNDTYNRLGKYNQLGDNTLTRIIEAWASAIGVDEFSAMNLVQFPKDPIYYLDRNSPTFSTDYAEAFQRASYLAKVTTKHYGVAGGNAFGCSRV